MSAQRSIQHTKLLPILLVSILFILVIIRLFGTIDQVYLNLGRLELNKSYIGREAVDMKTLNRSKTILSVNLLNRKSYEEFSVERGRAAILDCNYEEATNQWKKQESMPTEQAMFLHRWLTKQTNKTCNPENTLKFAIQNFPDYPQAYLRLSMLYRDEHNHELAIEILKQGIESKWASLFPHAFTNMHYLIARSYHAIRDLDNAMSYYQKTINLDPKNQHLWFTNMSYIYLGDLLLKQGEYVLAARSYIGSYKIAINERQKNQALKRIDDLLLQVSGNDQIQNLLEELLNE